jgi:hypothetical protein
MDKIASPQELRTELQRLVAYCQTEQPSRECLASEIRQLADRIAEDPSGPLSRENQRLLDEIEKHIGGAGKVLDVHYRGPGWTVVFDTEYAALKAFHAYARGGRFKIEKAPGLNGWAFVAL